jgi:hypothetical protein
LINPHLTSIITQPPPPVVGPIVGPLLGGGLSQVLGWRSTFASMAVCGAVICVALMLFMEEVGAWYLYRGAGQGPIESHCSRANADLDAGRAPTLLAAAAAARSGPRRVSPRRPLRPARPARRTTTTSSSASAPRRARWPCWPSASTRTSRSPGSARRGGPSSERAALCWFLLRVRLRVVDLRVDPSSGLVQALMHLSAPNHPHPAPKPLPTNSQPTPNRLPTDSQPTLSGTSSSPTSASTPLSPSCCTRRCCRRSSSCRGRWRTSPTACRRR